MQIKIAYSILIINKLNLRTRKKRLLKLRKIMKLFYLINKNRLIILLKDLLKVNIKIQSKFQALI